MTKPTIVLDIPVNHGRQTIISSDPVQLEPVLLRAFLTPDQKHVMISAWDRNNSVRCYFITGKDKIYHINRIFAELMDGTRDEIRIIGRAIYKSEDGYDCVNGITAFKKSNKEGQYEVKFLNEGTEPNRTYYMKLGHLRYVHNRFKELHKYIHSPSTYVMPHLG